MISSAFSVPSLSAGSVPGAIQNFVLAFHLPSSRMRYSCSSLGVASSIHAAIISSFMFDPSLI